MSEETSPPTLDKQAIREALAGYAAAAEVIERERRERLARMTPDESSAIFLGLLQSGQALIGNPSELDVFEERRLAETLAVRQVFQMAYEAGSHS